MLFDRICADNGIRHLLTAPRSPTTTGKVERFHRTLRREFLVDHDRMHDTIEELQVALDEWVADYNTTRPHQSLGDRPPAERFALAATAAVGRSRDATRSPDEVVLSAATARGQPLGRPTRFDRARGPALSGRVRPSPESPSRWWCAHGLVEILHAGVLVATHAERRRAEKGSAAPASLRGSDVPARQPPA